MPSTCRLSLFELLGVVVNVEAAEVSSTLRLLQLLLLTF